MVGAAAFAGTATDALRSLLGKCCVAASRPVRQPVPGQIPFKQEHAGNADARAARLAVIAPAAELGTKGHRGWRASWLLPPRTAGNYRLLRRDSGSARQCPPCRVSPQRHPGWRRRSAAPSRRPRSRRPQRGFMAMKPMLFRRRRGSVLLPDLPRCCMGT